MSLPTEVAHRYRESVPLKSTYCPLSHPKSSELGAMANNPSQNGKTAMTGKERFPELFVNTSIDRRKCSRVIPLKVIVVGMPRTGTQCMHNARIDNRVSETTS